MKYLLLMLVLICGCRSPNNQIIDDKGTMTVSSVQSWSIKDGHKYRYFVRTNSGNNRRESYFHTYSNKFYPVGTGVTIHFMTGDLVDCCSENTTDFIE